MNHNLQRKLNISKKKADMFDSERARTKQLEIANAELFRLYGCNNGASQVAAAGVSQISGMDYGAVSED